MVWEQSKLLFPNLQPAPSMGREDAPACFPTPFGLRSGSQGTLWDQSCAETELSQLLGVVSSGKGKELSSGPLQPPAVAPAAAAPFPREGEGLTSPPCLCRALAVLSACSTR